ncbi:MAG: nucleotide sugar dehydrogenase, partial [Bacteroidota bacterium]
MYEKIKAKETKISVVGLGYVGLPLALELAKKFSVIGFDINSERVAMMRNGIDPSKELEPEVFEGKDIEFTDKVGMLRQASFHIVAVPTPIDEHKNPNLVPLQKASESLGTIIKKGDYVVYESTVYPGCTEEDCIPIIERVSQLEFGRDFKAGYSPERINPGDRARTIDKILKIVSGSDEAALEEIAKVYGDIITAGIFKASSIKVAEAAKVIENSQRDLNIAFMNELAIIFDRLGIDTKEVLAAAGTKWNFLPFTPGLVGGHCIGVDPYYLVHKAKEEDYIPQVITSGRRINDEMPAHIAKRLTQMLIQKGKNPGNTKVLVKGITFKENVSDIRNSKVADLIREIESFSIKVDLVDYWASPEEVRHEYNIEMIEHATNDYDAILVAVAHDNYKKLQFADYIGMMNDHPILMDIK